MTGIFADLNQKGVLLNDIDTYFKEVTKDQQGPRVMMVVGVNGVGKTTTIGKLANRSAYAGLKTMVLPVILFVPLLRINSRFGLIELMLRFLVQKGSRIQVR